MKLFHISALLFVAVLALSACTPGPSQAEKEMQAKLEKLEERNKELREENTNLAKDMEKTKEETEKQQEKQEQTQKALEKIKEDKAGLWETCGTVVGIECGDGLRCKKEEESTDAQGVCVMDSGQNNAQDIAKTNTLKQYPDKSTPQDNTNNTQDTNSTDDTTQAQKELEAKLAQIEEENNKLEEKLSESEEVTSSAEEEASESTSDSNTSLTRSDDMDANAPEVPGSRTTVSDIDPNIPIESVWQSSRFGVQALYPQYWYWRGFAPDNTSDTLYIGFAPEFLEQKGDEILYLIVSENGEEGRVMTNDNIEITMQGPNEDYYFTFGGPEKFETAIEQMSQSLQEYEESSTTGSTATGSES